MKKHKETTPCMRCIDFVTITVHLVQEVEPNGKLRPGKFAVIKWSPQTRRSRRIFWHL